MELSNIAIKFKESFSDDLISLIISDSKNSSIKKHHVSLLICNDTGKLLSYGRNWLSESSCKYSLHSEVDCINRFYYKKKLPSGKKTLLNIRLSRKIQKIGNSKPCTNCKNYLLHHKDSLNLEKIIYTTSEELVTVDSDNLEDLETKLSTGDRPRD